LRLGQVGIAINHFNCADDENLADDARLEKGVPFPKGNFRLIDLDDAFERLSHRVDHRPPQLLSQQPRGFVSHPELILELPRRHAVGMRRHQMRRPKPRCQRQLRTMHRRARGDRGLARAVEALISVGAAFERCRSPAATGGADKAARPASLE
jgi:hypothetical protein